ncbi:MAG: hypothetical protein HOH19_13370 [Kordiimonadaceae bacterium]|nr:hypothetical protein [Kordiimonadaceae bacterium]MBT6033561.1 hypothetical protein [Kordiimonadaceae bacterium]
MNLLIKTIIVLFLMSMLSTSLAQTDNSESDDLEKVFEYRTMFDQTVNEFSLIFEELGNVELLIERYVQGEINRDTLMESVVPKLVVAREHYDAFDVSLIKNRKPKINNKNLKGIVEQLDDLVSKLEPYLQEQYELTLKLHQTAIDEDFEEYIKLSILSYKLQANLLDMISVQLKAQLLFVEKRLPVHGLISAQSNSLKSQSILFEIFVLSTQGEFEALEEMIFLADFEIKTSNEIISITKQSNIVFFDGMIASLRQTAALNGRNFSNIITLTKEVQSIISESLDTEAQINVKMTDLMSALSGKTQLTDQEYTSFMESFETTFDQLVDKRTTLELKRLELGQLMSRELKRVGLA